MIVKLIGGKDEATLRSILAKIRERTGFEVTRVSNGREITLEPVYRYTAFSKN